MGCTKLGLKKAINICDFPTPSRGSSYFDDILNMIEKASNKELDMVLLGVSTLITWSTNPYILIQFIILRLCMKCLS